jgi:hypothetical protein
MEPEPPLGTLQAAIHFMADRLEDARRIRILTVEDVFTRECPAAIGAPRAGEGVPTHAVPNFGIVGSSVFATCATANPTPMIGRSPRDEEPPSIER